MFQANKRIWNRLFVSKLKNEFSSSKDHSNTSDSAITSEDDEAYSNLSASDKSPKASFESVANRKQHEQFLRDCTHVLIEEAVFKATSRDNKVLEWRQPEELAKLLDLQPTDEGSTHKQLIQMMKDTIKYSVKTGHPYFVNQLFSGLDPYGLVGQWLTDALNPSVYTYEVSPVFTLMEECVLMEMRKIVGWTDGAGDGIFCPGGSMANGYAISCARHHFMPDIKKSGLHALPRLVLFTSQDAHYSVKKLASFMGLGSDNVIAIRTDSSGRMDPTDLQVQIDRLRVEGAAPFMVSATAGTTVLGAFDPLDQLADICEREGLWLHVDAAWGGGALVSPKYRNLLQGIHRADSVTWNPHKLLTAPQQCSTLLLRHTTGLLSSAHASHAAYLFQPDKCYDAARYDTGDKHIQCGRRADVLKFWFMWRAKGTSGLRQHVETVFALAEHYTALIRNRPGFRLVLDEPQCTNVCFWYIPASLRQLEGKVEGAEFRRLLHEVAPKMKARMMAQGSMMVTYQAQGDWPNFFRIVFQSSALTKQDMTHFIEEFERLGRDL